MTLMRGLDTPILQRKVRIAETIARRTTLERVVLIEGELRKLGWLGWNPSAESFGLFTMFPPNTARWNDYETTPLPYHTLLYANVVTIFESSQLGDGFKLSANVTTVDSVITHSSPWTHHAMGY